MTLTCEHCGGDLSVARCHVSRRRDDAIVARFQSTAKPNLAVIGREFGLTRERIRQILVREGYTVPKREPKVCFQCGAPAAIGSRRRRLMNCLEHKGYYRYPTPLLHRKCEWCARPFTIRRSAVIIAAGGTAHWGAVTGRFCSQPCRDSGSPFTERWRSLYGDIVGKHTHSCSGCGITLVCDRRNDHAQFHTKACFYSHRKLSRQYLARRAQDAKTT